MNDIASMSNVEELDKLYVVCRQFIGKSKEIKRHVFAAYTSLDTAIKGSRLLLEKFNNSLNRTRGVIYILECPINKVTNVFVPISEEEQE